LFKNKAFSKNQRNHIVNISESRTSLQESALPRDISFDWDRESWIKRPVDKMAKMRQDIEQMVA